MSFDTFAAGIGIQLQKLWTAVNGKVSLPKYLGVVSQTQYIRNPRAASGINDWGFTNATGTPEGASANTTPWSFGTKTCAKAVVNSAGTAAISVSFKPSNAMNALALSTGAAIPVYIEAYVEGATAGSTTITANVVWFGQSSTNVVLSAVANVVNGRLYRFRGNWIWPAPATVTAAGTNNVSINITLANAPAGAVLRATNASVGPGVTKFFDGNTPDTATTQYDWVGTANASDSTKRPIVAGDGTLVLANNGNWVTGGGGGGGATTMDGITDATAIGKALVRAANAAAGRTAIAAADDAAVVKLTTDQTVGGVKTFSVAPVVPDNSFTFAKLSGVGDLESLAPGSIVCCPWNGTAWTYNGTALTTRPSSRTDIFFELTGAPAATAAPGWQLAFDRREDI